MRKFRLYLKFYWMTLVLIVVSGACWYILRSSTALFETSFVSTALGIGLTLSVASGITKTREHRRIKRTLGLLKLTAIPYLTNQAENFKGFVNQHKDMCDLPAVMTFLSFFAHFDLLSTAVDRSWLQLLYSQDFIDAIGTDDQFNTIANAIFEIMLFTKQLTWSAVQAKHMLMVNTATLSKQDEEKFIKDARGMRNNLDEATSKFLKYINKLDDEVMRSLTSSGTSLKEFDR